MRIALTGGIACGKSLFAKFLAELGIQCLDADDVVHELEGSGGECVPEIVARFGSRIAGLQLPNGGINRAKLGELVFADSAARRELEAILLPPVRRRLLEFANGDGLRIAAIPLLFELSWDADYDIIICIASAQEIQLRRMIEIRGYAPAHAQARLAAQLPASEKARRAHFTVWNNTTPEFLQSEANRLLTWLKRDCKAI